MLRCRRSSTVAAPKTFLRKNIAFKPEGKRLTFAGNALPVWFAILETRMPQLAQYTLRSFLSITAAPVGLKKSLPGNVIGQGDARPGFCHPLQYLSIVVLFCVTRPTRTITGNARSDFVDDDGCGRR
jgi:hypothetical protein